jgi:hypothetical protein
MHSLHVSLLRNYLTVFRLYLVFQLEGLAWGYQILTVKEISCYRMLHRALGLTGSCELVFEPSGSIKGEEYLD